jgi:hypothetical protein
VGGSPILNGREAVEVQSPGMKKGRSFISITRPSVAETNHAEDRHEVRILGQALPSIVGRKKLAKSESSAHARTGGRPRTRPGKDFYRVVRLITKPSSSPDRLAFAEHSSSCRHAEPNVSRVLGRRYRRNRDLPAMRTATRGAAFTPQAAVVGSIAFGTVLAIVVSLLMDLTGLAPRSLEF